MKFIETKKLKDEMRKNVDNMTISNVKVSEVTTNIYELESY